jgi:hypothetical protein
MTIESTATLESRRALALHEGLVDLGHLPDRIRQVAQFWGGSTRDARPLYDLTRRDGMTADVDALRLSMIRVHDRKVRGELLGWLDSRIA